MNKEQIASNIAEARKRSGLNQSELARRLGITPQSVQQWEKGTSTPKIDRLAAIAQILGVSLESLTGQEPIPVAKEETVESEQDDTIKIPRFNATASMGAGDVVYPDEDQVVEHLSIRKSWLRQQKKVNFMGMTMTQKILAKHAHRDSVSAGDLLVSQVDLVLANDITGPPAINEFEKIGKPVFDKNKIALVPDHFSPCKDIKSATMCKRMRDFARKHEIKNSRSIS